MRRRIPLLLLSVFAGTAMVGGCDDADPNAGGPTGATGTAGTRPDQPDPCDTITADELASIFDTLLITRGDLEPLSCVWEIDTDKMVTYAVAHRIRGQGAEHFRGQRRQTPGKTQAVRGVGDDAYYVAPGPDPDPDGQPPFPDAQLHVRDGDFIFGLQVAAPRASRFKDELMELAEIALERGGPTYSFPAAP